MPLRRTAEAPAQLPIDKRAELSRAPMHKHGQLIRIIGASALILLLWAWAWVPQMIDLLVIGPQNPDFGESPQRSTLAGHVYQAIIIGLLIVSLFLIVGFLLGRGKPQWIALAILLAPWLAINATYVASGGRNNEIVIFPATLIALALNGSLIPKLYGLLRYLVAFTAISSIVLGLANPSLFLSDPTREVGNEKAIVGNLLLNGLMPTSNQLGIVLGIGIPLTVVTGTSRLRWLSALAAAIAMTWAASRTSLATTVYVLIVIAIASKVGPKSRLSVYKAAAAGAATFSLLAPFIFTDPAEFSRRVSIWQASLSFVSQGHLWGGGGALMYRVPSKVTTAVGAVTGTGHNIFITILTTGGLVAVGTLVLLWFTYLRRASAQFPLDRYPIVFILTVSSLAVLEDPVRAFIIAPASFLVIPLLAMPLARSYDPQPPDQQARFVT